MREVIAKPVVLLASLGLALVIASASTANPIQATYTDRNNCDFHPTMNFPEELGQGPSAAGGPAGPFPVDEAISYSSFGIEQGTCGITADGDDDWLVKITNQSGKAWVDLFFVANADRTFSNFDGEISELGSENSGLAMRIDNIDINQPLLSESIDPDLVFQPGETWDFIVLDFTSSSNIKFDSLGVAHFGGNSTASIVARPIPEPTTATLLGLGLAGLAHGLRRVRR